MFNEKNLNRILCYIPFSWVIGFFTIVLTGMIRLGKIPVYGADPDPYALGMGWINIIMLVSLFVSLFSIPLSLALTMNMVTRKDKFSFAEKISLLLPVFSVTMFFICKYFLPGLFEWVMD